MEQSIENILNEFQKILRSQRIKSGRTAKGIAFECGINSQTFHKYESNPGEMPLKTLIKLLKILQTPASKLTTLVELNF